MKKMLRGRTQILLTAIGAILGGVACTDVDISAVISVCVGSSDPTPPDPEPVDPSDAFFAPDHLVQVTVELAPEDWQALRLEGRNLLDAFEGKAWEYDYTKFTGIVTIDGTRYENVEIRKKGFNGSISIPRPSLKVDLSGQNHAGIKKLTFNNNRQDPSNTHQCMAYGLFTKAGLPAPRCNLAHVMVNGEDLGTYTNLEPVNKQTLARHFADNSGNLYEGEAADFVPESVDRIEAKTNEKTNDRSDLVPVVAALAGSDDSLVSTLGASVDLDNFRTYWAMEVLLGHWDSYSGNANNYFAYHEPTSNKFYFIPWGTDSAFEGPNLFNSVNTSITVFAKGKIANRLYALPEQRELYRKRLGELNDSIWNESAMLAEVELVAKLAPKTPADALEKQRNLIRTHAEQLRTALSEPAPEWIDESALPKSPCYGMRSELTSEFQTTWGDLTTLAPGAGTFTMGLSLEGQLQNATWFGMAGADTTMSPDPLLRILGILPDGRLLFMQFIMPAVTVKPGVQPFHGFESWGTLGVIEGQSFRSIGVISDGAITFQQASTENSAPVVGSIAGHLLQFECLGEATPPPSEPAPTPGPEEPAPAPATAEATE